MSTIYIVSDYGKLVKNGDVLQLKKDDDVLKTIFPFKTEQLIIIGNVEITSHALKSLMFHNIDAVFLGNNGKFNGKITFQDGKSKNVFLRQKQYKMLEDAGFCLNIAKSIVSAKLQNQYSFMQRLKRKREYDSKIMKSINGMKGVMKQVEDSLSVEQLRGYEGLGAKYYFDSFRFAIEPEWAKFNGRSKRPPKDNVNAILSLLYTLVMFRVDAAVEAAGLDNYVGYFHALDYGRRTLSLDLLEEYRTPIADALTASLFNLGILDEDDFRNVVFSAEGVDEGVSHSDGEGQTPTPEGGKEELEAEKGVLLTKTGLRKVLEQLERKLDTSFYYSAVDKDIKYRELFFEQAKHFRRVVSGEESCYKPLTLK